MEKIFIVNSAAFITEKKVYEKIEDRLDNKPLPIISRPGAGLDIDNYIDFMKLKAILKKK